jgi:hypothetical protein
LDSTGPRPSIFDGLKAVIANLSDGYNLVLRRIWLIALPIALDLYLWFGPRLSARPLTRLLLSFFESPEQLPEQSRQAIETIRVFLQTAGQKYDLFALLSNSLVGMPSYLSAGPPSGISGSAVVWGENGSALGVMALGLLLTALGLLLGSLYLAVIAQITRSGRIDLGHLFRRLWRYWGLIALFAILLLGALSAVGVPVLMLALLLAGVSPPMAELALYAALGLLLWMIFHLVFVPHGIVSEEGLFRAVWNSLIIVVRNFWSALFLIVLMNLIAAGFGAIWDALSVNAALTLVSVAGNAFVSTGLIAASLIFYRDRLEQWLAWVNQIRAASGQDSNG